ncbi:MAG: four helix bundle protein [bacterium]
MQIKQFEDIIAWQKSKELTTDCYKVFVGLRDFSFRDQILRAAISIMNNIAEGFERRSNKEFKNFLFIAKGSCGEVRSMLYMALELKYVSGTQYNNLNDKSLEISKILSGFIKKL